MTFTVTVKSTHLDESKRQHGARGTHHNGDCFEHKEPPGVQTNRRPLWVREAALTAAAAELQQSQCVAGGAPSRSGDQMHGMNSKGVQEA